MKGMLVDEKQEGLIGESNKGNNPSTETSSTAAWGPQACPRPCADEDTIQSAQIC